MGVYLATGNSFTFDDIRNFIRKSNNRSFVVMSPPSSSSLDLVDVCCAVSISDTDVFKLHVLNTPKGAILRDVLDAGLSISIKPQAFYSGKEPQIVGFYCSPHKTNCEIECEIRYGNVDPTFKQCDISE